MAEVVSVRFRSGAKIYYFDPRDLKIETGQFVVVDTAQGQEYAKCAEGNHEVPDSSVILPLRRVLRIATENDQRTVAYNRQREKDAVGIFEQKVREHGLEMRLVNVECCFDGNKIIFFFTADGRVDFRELVRDLAGVFRARIELRQIGVRDEAKILGGIGICGRPLCCNQFLSEFIPVSIKMAKTQNLSLNPTKISGSCGRLMCCLKYEQTAYEDAAERLPRAESFVDTPDGVGNVSGVDLLREQVEVRLDSAPETPKRYQNGEVRVLRSGKGSREGIDIPKDRPQRQAPPEKADARFRRIGPGSGSFRDAEPAVPAMDESASDGFPRRTNHNNRNNNNFNNNYNKGAKNRTYTAGKRQDKRPPDGFPRQKYERQERPGQIEKLPVRPATGITAEKKAAADRAARQQYGDGRQQYKYNGKNNMNRRRTPYRRPQKGKWNQEEE